MISVASPTMRSMSALTVGTSRIRPATIPHDHARFRPHQEQAVPAKALPIVRERHPLHLFAGAARVEHPLQFRVERVAVAPKQLEQQLRLVTEVRVERAARVAGLCRDLLDARRDVSLLRKDRVRGAQQAFARPIPLLRRGQARGSLGRGRAFGRRLRRIRPRCMLTQGDDPAPAPSGYPRRAPSDSRAPARHTRNRARP